MIQCSMARASWTATWSLRAVRQNLKERAAARRWHLKPMSAQCRGWRYSARRASLRSKRTDKEMGNFWVWFWFVIFWEAKEVLGLVGEKGWEQKCSQLPPNWKLLIKTCFLQNKCLGHVSQRQVAKPHAAQLHFITSRKVKTQLKRTKDLRSVWRKCCDWLNVSKVICKVSCWRFLAGWYSTVG